MRPVPPAVAAQSSWPYGAPDVVVDAAALGRDAAATLPALARAFDAVGLDGTIRVADERDDVARLTAEALDAGRRFVVAVGDDGTVADAVGGMFREGRTIVERPVLGVVPAGAGSELTRSFGLPADVRGAVTHLAGDATYALDVMRVRATGPDGAATTRYGCNVTQVGLRAAAAVRAASLPAWAGRARRFLGFWSAYLTTRRRPLTVHVDARTHELEGWDVAVANGQFVDGGMRLSPRSYPGDGVLDTLVFVGPRADAYRMLPRILMNGGHLPDPGVKELRARIRVAVEAPRPLPVVLDGRPFGRTPVTVQIVPQQVLLKL